jgi:hypothetical protein
MLQIWHFKHLKCKISRIQTWLAIPQSIPTTWLFCLTILPYFWTYHEKLILLTSSTLQGISYKVECHIANPEIPTLWDKRCSKTFTPLKLELNLNSVSFTIIHIKLSSQLYHVSSLSFPFRFTKQNLVHISQVFHACYVLYPFQPPLFNIMSQCQQKKVHYKYHFTWIHIPDNTIFMSHEMLSVNSLLWQHPLTHINSKNKL